MYETVDNQFLTFGEMLESVKEKQTDKDGKTVALYTTNTDEQHSYIAAAKDRGYEILKLDATLDSHFINLLEQKMVDKNIHFKRVDAETLDKLIDKDEKIESILNEEQETKEEKEGRQKTKCIAGFSRRRNTHETTQTSQDTEEGKRKQEIAIR